LIVSPLEDHKTQAHVIHCMCLCCFKIRALKSGGSFDSVEKRVPSCN
jgi:hypothetical protein